MTPNRSRLAVSAALLVLPLTLTAKMAGVGDVWLTQGTDRLPGGVERMPTAPPSIQAPRDAMPAPMPLPPPSKTIPSQAPATATQGPPPPSATKPVEPEAPKRPPDKP